MKRAIDRKKSILCGITLVVFVIMLAMSYRVFAEAEGQIHKNVHIIGIDLSYMTVDEAEDALAEAFESYIQDEITLRAREYVEVFAVNDISDGYDISAMAQAAYNQGRTGSRLSQTFQRIRLLWRKDLSVLAKLDDDIILSVVRDFTERYESKKQIIQIEQDHVVVKPNLIYDMIDRDASVKRINTGVINGAEEIEMAVSRNLLKSKKADLLYQHIAREPVDAEWRVVNGSLSIIPDSDGIVVSKADISKAVSFGQQTSVPISRTPARITTEEIEASLFVDVLADITTRFDNSVWGRTTNINLAASKVNGYVLAPGDVFSFNDVVGRRTIEAGFATGMVFEGGSIVEGIGGGICQVSSSLYSAALRTTLEIVERTNHTFTVGYLPAGEDATVSYGALDFQFRNSYDEPMKIVCNVNGGSVNVKFMGVNPDKDLKIDVEHVHVATRNFNTVSKPNPDASITREIVTQAGIIGRTVDTYKRYTKGGSMIESEYLHRSVYVPMDRTTLTPTAPVQIEEPPIVEAPPPEIIDQGM